MRLIQNILEDQKIEERCLEKLELDLARIKQQKIIKKAELAMLELEHQEIRGRINTSKAIIRENDEMLGKLGNKT